MAISGHDPSLKNRGFGAVNRHRNEAYCERIKQRRSASKNKSEILHAAFGLARSTQQMLFAGRVFGNRTLKTVQRRGPKFHAIQIFVQALKRLDEIANDLAFRLFWHCPWALSPDWPC